MFCFEDTFISVEAFGGVQVKKFTCTRSLFSPIVFSNFQFEKRTKIVVKL